MHSTTRQSLDPDGMARNMRAANLAHNATAPRYAKRTVKLRKLRHKARQAIAEIKANEVLAKVK